MKNTTAAILMLTAINDGSDMISREQLIDDYLDFVNNYLTVSLFGEHRGLTEGQARILLDLAKTVFDSPHPEA